MLALELQELSVEPNFDVTITGFDTAENDILISEASDAEPNEADIVPEMDRSAPPVSRLGDLWRIGPGADFTARLRDQHALSMMSGE